MIGLSSWILILPHFQQRMHISWAEWVYAKMFEARVGVRLWTNPSFTV